MAKVGSWKWEGKQKIQKALDKSHSMEMMIELQVKREALKEAQRKYKEAM